DDPQSSMLQTSLSSSGGLGVRADPYRDAITPLVAQLDAVSVWAWVAGIVLVLAVLLYFFAYWIIGRVPLWIVGHTLYRITVHGKHNVPATGPVLLVSNHVSHIDALLMQFCLHRPIRFLIWAPFLHVWWLRPFLRGARVI